MPKPRMRHLALAAGLLVLGLALAMPFTVNGQAASALRPAIAVEYGEIDWVDAPTLAGWLEGDHPVILLDTRARAEFAVSHLRNARWVDPDIEDVSTLNVPHDTCVVVYCSVGWRSGRVTDLLRQAGHPRARNLEGGIFTWANQGRPVYRGGERVRAVHPYDETWGRMLRRPLRAYRP
ncbi:MAG: rhodanese-like domain-containing protein [Sandaracinaceae bacterium]